jgi:hypothetical protein
MRLALPSPLAASLPLAAATALASAFTPAHADAVAPACATFGTLASYSSACTLPGSNGISLQILSPTAPGHLLSINEDNGAFGPFFNAAVPAGSSFQFVVNAQTPGTYFNFADLLFGSNNAAEVQTPSFTLNTNGGDFTNTDTTLTSLTGTFSYSSTTTTGSSLLLTTTEVPAPLPLLGAGFAFGFSRKLRKRTKTAA